MKEIDKFIEKMQENCFSTSVIEHLYHELLFNSEKCKEGIKLHEDILYSHEYRTMHNSFLNLSGFIWCAYSMLQITCEERKSIFKELLDIVSLFEHSSEQ